MGRPLSLPVLALLLAAGCRSASEDRDATSPRYRFVAAEETPSAPAAQAAPAATGKT